MPTGAEVITEVLQRCGVEHVFGVPGTQNVALFEALRRSRLRTVLASHELGAAFMANGYYRSSGKPGVLITIGGPGLAYAVAGIAEAAQDSSALLHITVLPPNRRKFDLQSIDQAAIMAPLVKRVIDVRRSEDLANAVADGFRETTAEEPGPVLVQVERALFCAQTPRPEASRLAVEPQHKNLTPEMLDEILGLISRSRRPTILVGQGVNHAAPELVQLAEMLGAPVVTTRSARGVLPETHRLSFVFDASETGSHGANALFEKSDLILAIGCKLSHNGSFGFRLRLPKEKLIRCDRSAEVLNGDYPARIGSLADARVFLADLIDAKERLDCRCDWSAEEFTEFRRLAEVAKVEVEPSIDGATPPTAAAFFEALQRAMPKDSCLVTDSGLHQVLATRHLRVRHPRGFIIPSDFQSMGFGLPAAIGAKLANPGHPVVALIGDGGLAMSGMELLTAAREGVALTIVIFNDGALGQIRLQQLSSFGFDHATTLLTPDLGLLARAMGLQYYRIRRDIANVLPRVIYSPGVNLLEVKVRDGLGMHVERVKGVVRTTVRRLTHLGTNERN